MANKADKTALEAKADVSALANYATTEALTSGLANKADASALAAKQDVMSAGNGIEISGVKAGDDTITVDGTGVKVTEGKFTEA